MWQLYSLFFKRRNKLPLLTQAFYPKRHYIALLQKQMWLHAHANTRRCACGDDVARFQGHDAELLRVRHVVARDQPQTNRAESIATLAISIYQARLLFARVAITN